ncbi:MAG: lipoyl(octanoyl) transferase LipB [Pseudomonadota bacterium]
MPEGIKKPLQPAILTDLGRLDYQKALDLQKKLVQGKIDGTIKEDHILLVEHPSVFTLGRRGGMENLIKDLDFLNQKKISIIQTQRGGNITYHGPGQVVVYPVFDLKRFSIGVKDFVCKLEEIMKQTCLDVGITTNRDIKNNGLWLRNAKIGSVGLAIIHDISMHGFALNITVDLKPFSWINPCGLNDICVTSIQNEYKKQGWNTQNLSMENIKKSIATHFSTLFNLTFINAHVPIQ